MSPEIISEEEGFSECAGISCKNKATRILTIRYVKKKGNFCDSCAAKLKELQIAFDGEVA